ncbi:hypothetical protein SLEP1_g19895 [Rubroshorea leprosula]|uniref:Uncharacterized protein n=1 Tax=Rubroshorea leprosula TaxID=152421 RepID=A0AAV5JBE5_9ROSI|nr:hypothetical protein SLEP1_g19895 [Rubroshorea leprosula]
MFYSPCREMGSPSSTPVNPRKQTLPPKRGQIKIRIIKCLFRLVTTLASMATKKGRNKGREKGSRLSSGCTTTAASPSGNPSDGSLTY